MLCLKKDYVEFSRKKIVSLFILVYLFHVMEMKNIYYTYMLGKPTVPLYLIYYLVMVLCSKLKTQ